MNKTNKGFSLLELLIVVAIILIIATIAIPSLLRSRQAAHEAAAVATLRTINTAEVTYLSTAAGKFGTMSDLINNALIPSNFVPGPVSGYQLRRSFWMRQARTSRLRRIRHPPTTVVMVTTSRPTAPFGTPRLRRWRRPVQPELRSASNSNTQPGTPGRIRAREGWDGKGEATASPPSQEYSFQEGMT